MSCTRSQYVKQMQAWVGLKESDGSFKKIIDLYNTIKPLPVGYKLKYTDAWCAGTVSAAAQACGAVDIIPAECSCPRMITKAKSMGIWVENDAHKPTAGDIMEGKYTPPIMKYVDFLSSGERDIFREKFKNGTFTDEDRLRIAADIRRLCFDAEARAMADQYLDKAQACLDKLPRRFEQKVFREALDFVRNRKS